MVSRQQEKDIHTLLKRHNDGELDDYNALQSLRIIMKFDNKSIKPKPIKNYRAKLIDESKEKILWE